MGCNNSKLNSSEGEVLPAKIRPLLRQRIEEFRKRKNVREEGDLSKKQLLKDDDIDDGNSQTHSSDEHEIKETETQPPKEQLVVRVVVPVEKLSKVVPLPLPISECEIEEKLKKEKDVENKPEIKIVAVSQEENKHEEVIPKHDDDDEDDDDDDEEEETDDDDEDEENEIGRFIGPGSPSFRIYCIEAEKRKEREIRGARHIDTNEYRKKEKENENEDEEEEKEKETIPLHNKSLSTDSDGSVASASENSGNSNKVLKMETTPLKRRKRHKIKKLKKNLLNVKNIPMNRMMTCAGNNDRRSLLSNK